MMNRNTDTSLRNISQLEQLIAQRRSPPILSKELDCHNRKRPSSELCTSPTQSIKRQRRFVSYESKVPPSKVGLVSFEPNDVLSGRGGGTNQHEGNCFFRSLINKNRERYLRSKKNDKPYISLSIVNTIRQRKGRFLKKDEDSGLWYEIGDALAREKTSQALRQRAPEYRKQLFEKDTMRTQVPLEPSPLIKLSSSTPPRSPMSVVSEKDLITRDLVREAIQARVRQSKLQEARQVLRLHQKLQAIKVLELELMLQSSNRYFPSL